MLFTYVRMNRLTTVSDSLSLTYDLDGRLTADALRIISSILYVPNDMPLCVTTDSFPRLIRVNLPWGYLDADGSGHAYIPDHQGNIRAVIDRNGTIEQTTDYYPYGLPMATSTGAEVNPYKYAGTRSVSEPFERSRENEFETRKGLNFHDFEARMLFNDRTLFNRPDPQAQKYPHLNPTSTAPPTPSATPTPPAKIYGKSTIEEKL